MVGVLKPAIALDRYRFRFTYRAGEAHEKAASVDVHVRGRRELQAIVSEREFDPTLRALLANVVHVAATRDRRGTVRCTRRRDQQQDDPCDQSGRSHGPTLADPIVSVNPHRPLSERRLGAGREREA